MTGKVKKSIAFMLVLAMMFIMLTACATNDTKTTEATKTPASTTVADATTAASTETEEVKPEVKNAEVIRIGTTYANTPFNTATSDGAFGRVNYNSFVRLNLCRFDENGVLTGDGCFFKSWDISEDNTSLIVEFAPLDALYWHDGNPVTTDDVLFTFDFYKENKHTWFMKVEDVEILSDTSMKISFDSSCAFSFLNQITLMYTIMPKHIWENVEDPSSYTEADAAIGCGPFKFVSNDPDAQISYYEAVENYPIGDITVNRVQIHSLENQAAIAMALVNDEIDVMYAYSASLDPTLLTLIDAEENLDRGESQNSATYQLIFGFNNFPTNDKDFRMAVRYALDYNLFSDYLTGGFGTPANQGAISPSALGYNGTLPINAQDIEKSKQILDDAGFVDTDGDGMRELPDGSEMNVMVALQGSNETYKRMAEILETNLAAVGIRVTVDEETISNPDHMTKLRMEGTYELYLGMTTVGIAVWTGIVAYIAAITMTSSQRFGTYADPAYLKAYDDMMTARNYDEYIAAIQIAQQMNVDECPGIALAIMQSFFPYRTDHVTGWTNYPAWGVINGSTWYTAVSAE